MPAGVGYSGRRGSANFNKQVGLGAGNTPGNSAYSQGKMFKYQDRLARMSAFDAGQSGRSTSKVRMVPGLGSGPNYTGSSASASRSGYGGLASNSAVRQNSKRIGNINPTVNGNVRSRSLGTAAMGRSAPLGLPAAGQSMASPAGGGYGALVSRGDVARNASAGNRSTSAASRSVTGSAGSIGSGAGAGAGYSGYAGMANQYLDQPVGSGYAGLATRRNVMANSLNRFTK